MYLKTIHYALFAKHFLKTKKGKYALRLWHKKIIKRDKMCNICKSTKNLQAHHLYSKHTHPYIALNPKNGIALCKYHHKDFHISFMGGYQVPTTPKDFRKYKHSLKKPKSKLTSFWLFIKKIFKL